MTETQTIQTWPSGQSFEYRGDPNGPAEQRSLRNDWRGRLEIGVWRKGQPEEWRQIVISRRAERYSDVEILCCDSALVDDLIKATGCGELANRNLVAESAGSTLAQGFSYDEIRNLYPNPEDWDADKCLEWLEDAVGGPDSHTSDCPHRFSGPCECRDAEALRQQVRDHAEPAEVYEWWRVSSWLCEQLHDIGEVTIDNNYGYWWGRTCTGQGYLMDGTLQRVAAQFD